MASLARRKSRLVFTTCDIVRERGQLREVVIEAGTHVATVRLAGTRTRFEISYAAIYHAAAKLAAAKLKAEKKGGRR